MPHGAADADAVFLVVERRCHRRHRIRMRFQRISVANGASMRERFSLRSGSR